MSGSDEDPREPLTPEVAPSSDPGSAMPDPGAMPDLGALLEQAQQMQEQMLAAQDEVTETVVAGHAGGGVVRIEVTGAFEFRSVTIDPAAVDPDDVEMLQDLVLAALRDAVEQVTRLQAQSMGGLGLGGPDLGGLDLGGLFGTPGEE